jgi:hypothetical protein
MPATMSLPRVGSVGANGPRAGAPAGGVAGSRLWPLPVDPTARRLRAVRDGLILSGWLAAAFVFVVIVPTGDSLGYDAYSYWSLDPAAVYARTWDDNFRLGAFRYAPPVALLFLPFTAVPWWVFVVGYGALMAAILVWLGGRWTLALLALPPVALELYHGNVHLLIAAAVALGMRHPAAWSFVLLSKVTPGVGLLWFAVRREWRSLAIALVATAAAAGTAAVVAPSLWADWIGATLSNLDEPQQFSVPPPLAFRLPLAAALVVWGARTDRTWTVAVAATAALPILWVHGLVVMLAAVPLLRRRASLGSRLLDPEHDAGWTAVPRGRDLVVASAVALAAAAVAVVVAGPWIEAVIDDASRALHRAG